MQSRSDSIVRRARTLLLLPLLLLAIAGAYILPRQPINLAAVSFYKPLPNENDPPPRPSRSLSSTCRYPSSSSTGDYYCVCVIPPPPPPSRLTVSRLCTFFFSYSLSLPLPLFSVLSLGALSMGVGDRRVVLTTLVIHPPY